MTETQKIPGGWAFAIASDACLKVQSGSTPKGKPFTETGEVPFLKVYNIVNQRINFDYRPQFVTREIHQEKLARSVTKPGDILMNIVGPPLGKVAIVTDQYQEWNINQAIVLFRPTEALLAKYLYFHLCDGKLIRDVVHETKGIVGQVNISLTQCREHKIPVPPLNEQRRIVAKIEELTARSAKARQALDEIPALLDQFRRSVLAAAFRGDLTKDWREQNPDIEPAEKLLERIRTERRQRWEEAELAKMRAKGKEPKNDKWKAKYSNDVDEPVISIPYELPDKWIWVRWKQVGVCQNGRAFPSKEYSETGTKLLRPGNLNISGKVEWTNSNTRFMPDNWAERYPDHIIHDHELVINLTAQSLADEFLGRVCLTMEGERCLLNQRIARLSPFTIASKFCLWLFKSPIFRKYVDTLNTGSMIQHMFTHQIDEFFLPLPPLREQLKIVEIIEQQFRKVNEILSLTGQSFEELDHLSQSILAKAFRGELVPQDPTDEPAAVLLERIRAEREKSKATQKKPRRKRTPKATRAVK